MDFLNVKKNYYWRLNTFIIDSFIMWITFITNYNMNVQIIHNNLPPLPKSYFTPVMDKSISNYGPNKHLLHPKTLSNTVLIIIISTPSSTDLSHLDSWSKEVINWHRYGRLNLWCSFQRLVSSKRLKFSKGYSCDGKCWQKYK